MSAVISLKAVIDKVNNRVLYVESDHDFVDILFGFLTEPMGQIIRLVRNHVTEVGLGSMDNLYQSVEDLDVKYFRTQTCKTMLLQPRNGNVVNWSRLKLQFDNGFSLKHYYCQRRDHLAISSCSYNLVSYYSTVKCQCGHQMGRKVLLEVGLENAESDCGGVFVKALNRYLISDAFQVVPASTKAILYFISKLGVKVGTDVVEFRDFELGATEVINLLQYSLIYKTALTETLLQHKNIPKSTGVSFDRVSPRMLREEEESGDMNMRVVLSVSKSMQMVCYAEVGEDFVNLLLSFLSVPLGYTLKQMQGRSSQGCMHYLYKSVQDFNVDKLKTDRIQDLLLNPKIAMGFGYQNQLLGVEEVQTKYYSTRSNELTTKRQVGLGINTIRDPKSDGGENAGKGVGFLKASAMFTVTDNLIITPWSSTSCLSILSKMNIHLDDLYEHTAMVNREDALRLLVASFVSVTVLTDVFLNKKFEDASLFKIPKLET